MSVDQGVRGTRDAEAGTVSRRAFFPGVGETTGESPDVRRRFSPRPCMQCHEPPCVPVCPVSSTYKRPDGIVEIDYQTCIGCGLCVAACPYEARPLGGGGLP